MNSSIRLSLLLPILVALAGLGCSDGPTDDGESGVADSGTIDAGPNDAGTPSLAIQILLDQGDNRDVHVTAIVSVEGASDYVPSADHLSIAADTGSLAPAVGAPSPPSQFETFLQETLRPPEMDLTDDIWTGEIPITASYSDPANGLELTTTSIALILSAKLSGIGHPEKVPGLVNTQGTEDSPQISRDGAWLTVGTYCPADVGFCQIQGMDIDSQGCNQNFFDLSGQERPGMFGADRILDNETITHAIPSIGYDPDEFPTPIGTPPVSSYVFKRQADGSYAEPKVLGVDAGGYTWNAAYGFSFDSIVGNQARVVFSYNRLDDTMDSFNDIYMATISLGEENRLGEYVDANFQNFTGELVPLDGMPVCGAELCEYGNPDITEDYLWFDNERQTDDLYFSAITRDEGGKPIAFSASQKIPLSQPSRGETMPFMDNDTLYYQCDTKLCRSSLTSGADPALPGSWSAEEVVFDGSSNVSWQIKGGRSGRIVATTEPSVARYTVNGEEQTWLYFGYIMQIHYGAADDQWGGDWAVGRVRLD